MWGKVKDRGIVLWFAILGLANYRLGDISRNLTKFKHPRDVANSKEKTDGLADIFPRNIEPPQSQAIFPDPLNLPCSQAPQLPLFLSHSQQTFILIL